MTVRQQHNNDDGGNNKSNSTNSSNTSNANAVANLARPKSVSQWSQIDVQKWLRKTCSDYYHLYAEKFLDQDITGQHSIIILEFLLSKAKMSHKGSAKKLHKINLLLDGRRFGCKMCSLFTQFYETSYKTYLFLLLPSNRAGLWGIKSQVS